MTISELNYRQFTDLLLSMGVVRLFIKRLAENDNSKNQVYLGSDFSAVQIIPNQGINPDGKTFKAKVNFHWLDEERNINPALGAQLILYPDYPEVRFSGFLRGVKNPPSVLMRERLDNRVMFWGICQDDRVIGFVTTEGTPLVNEINNLPKLDTLGVFYVLPFGIEVAPRTALLRELKRIHLLGWINSKRLTSAGIQNCLGQNCGGLTLEAELGIASNSRSEPDFLGYEVKQYQVRDFTRLNSGSAITLMTPEPQGGVYKDQGVETFVRKFGYLDKKIGDRMNFSGIHRANERHSTTGLTLQLDGYDSERNLISDVNGGIKLLCDDGTIAALWKFEDIISHWSRKHSHAVYVPSKNQEAPVLQYCYGHIVLVAEKTDPLFLLKAISSKKVYYDPGIHLENISTHPRTKRRSQFRISCRDIGLLYENPLQENLLMIQ